MKIKTKNVKSRLRLEIKEITEQGTFEGLLSPYGNVDHGGDIVEPGAYTKTLKERGNKVPMLWQHKSDTPIGELTLEDRKDGLWCKGQLLLDLDKAQEAYKLIKARIVKGLSIGFETIKDSIESGVRHLKEIRLYEGSIVTFPMNEMAQITDVKAHENKGDFNEELRQYQILDAYYQMLGALSMALSDCTWSDMEPDEKTALCETILEQFTSAFSAFYPDYLATLAEVYGIGREEWAAKRELELKAMKAGARFSAASKSTINSVVDRLTDAQNDLKALVSEEAGDSTSEEKAADIPSEPAEDHSATLSLLDELKGLLN